MREITPAPFTVYRLDELEPKARQRAIESVAEKLGGDWWDSGDNDDVRKTMVYALAEALGTPNVHDFGEGDFPGIPGVTVDGWDLGRADSLALKGQLTRESAPALPWSGNLHTLDLSPGSTGTDVTADASQVPYRDGGAAMVLAIRDALRKATEAGRERMRYLSSEENAVDDIEANEREFHADGSLYR